MEKIRKPFQGVLNIIRFNWHFYIIASSLVIMMFVVANFFEQPFNYAFQILSILSFASVIISLLASFYVYDLSRFYSLNWINQNDNEKLIVNIHAGFDETSDLLKGKFKRATIIVLDFYDPEKHTEVSIKRARKAFPSFSNTKHILTSNTELPDNSVDKIFVILSAHEIRNVEERTAFFKELHRAIKTKGEIYVTEHLRDLPNFLAYNIGFFHFYSKSSWLKTFNKANLEIKKEIKITPFISTFILYKDANTL